MSKKDTATVQNVISRLQVEMVLEVESPSQAIKAQYAKVKKTFIDLALQLDILNDMKDER